MMMTPSQIFWGTVAFMGAITTSLHALLNRRTSRAVAWWVLFVWVFPWVGPILYLVFGINRIERKAHRLRKKMTRQFPSLAVKSSDASRTLFPEEMAHLERLSHLVERVIGKPLTNGNKIRPLKNGDEAYPAMLAAIDGAQKTVALSTYIFNHDSVGEKFLAALIRAHHRGIQVRVLIDDVGSGYNWRSIFRELENHHIPVAYFLPTFAPWQISYMNLRNHRKILTVDGDKAFTGGINIHANHMLSLGGATVSQDLHFQIEGPVVAQVQETFRVDWFFTTRENLDGEAWFPNIRPASNMVARGLADGPDEDFDKCRLTLLAALANARRSVRIVTPYFVPDPTLVSALSIAALSGVRVDIVLSKTTDMRTVRWAGQSLLWQVLERGCHVWETPPPFNHTKLMVVDGGWTLFGSSNWDSRSLRLNFEFNVECYDQPLALQMEKHVDELIKSGREITRTEMEDRPYIIKVRDAVAGLFAPLL